MKLNTILSSILNFIDKVKVGQPTPVEIVPTPIRPQIPISNAIVFDFVSTNTSGLQEADFVAAAKTLNVEVVAIKAVTQVESSGSAYLASKRPKILFEAAYFSKLTGHKYDDSYPTISSAKWDKTLYKGGEIEYDRLAKAIALNENAALQSASWGMFQIMGDNYLLCGYDNVHEFVAAQVAGTAGQLKAFMYFCKARGLDVHLRNKDWAAFAKGYNGPAYAQNQYDAKLKAAYDKLTNGK